VVCSRSNLDSGANQGFQALEKKPCFIEDSLEISAFFIKKKSPLMDEISKCVLKTGDLKYVWVVRLLLHKSPWRKYSRGRSPVVLQIIVIATINVVIHDDERV